MPKMWNEIWTKQRGSPAFSQKALGGSGNFGKFASQKLQDFFQNFSRENTLMSKWYLVNMIGFDNPNFQLIHNLNYYPYFSTFFAYTYQSKTKKDHSIFHCSLTPNVPNPYEVN